MLVARFGTWRGTLSLARGAKNQFVRGFVRTRQILSSCAAPPSVLSLLSDSEKRCLLPKFATDEVEDAAREYLEQVARSE